MSRIIFTNENGNVSVVNPSTGVATDELAAKIVPPGVEYEIVNDDAIFPPDELFFDAWRWAGKGKQITEDLEKSKECACEQVKAAAIQQFRKTSEAALFDDSAVKAAEGFKSECRCCLDAINAASTPYEAKVLMCSYCELPAPQQSSSN